MVSIGTIFGGLVLLVGGIVGFSIFQNRDQIADSVSSIFTGTAASITTTGSNIAAFVENLVPQIDPVKIVNPFLGLPGAIVTTARQSVVNPLTILNPFPEAGAEEQFNPPPPPTPTQQPQPGQEDETFNPVTPTPPPEERLSLLDQLFILRPTFESFSDPLQNRLASNFLKSKDPTALGNLLDRYKGFGDFSPALQNRLLENTLRSSFGNGM